MGNSSFKNCTECIADRPLNEMRPIYNLNSQQILGCTSYFQQQDMSPGVDLRILTDILNHSGRRDKAATEEELVSMFQCFDDDQNGRIDLYEVFAAMIFVSSMSTLQKIKALFETFDLNADRNLSRDEAVIMTRSIIRGASKLTGGIMPQTRHIEEVCNNVFKKADKIRDNKVTYVEWLSYIQDEQQVLHCLEKLKPNTSQESLRKMRRLSRASQEDSSPQLNTKGAHRQRPVRSSFKSSQQQNSRRDSGKESTRARRVKYAHRRSSHSHAEGSKYSKKDIMELAEIFNEMCDPDTREVYLSDLRKSLASSDVADFTEAMFHVLDQDHTGKVTLLEFLKVLYPKSNARDHRQWDRWTRPPTPPPAPVMTYTAEGMAEMRHIFELYDTSHDGFVTAEDLVAASGLDKSEIQKMISELGKSHDAKLNFDEFVQLLGPLLEEQVEQV